MPHKILDCALLISLATACGRISTKNNDSRAELPTLPPASAVSSSPVRAPLAGERVEIPSGAFQAGSRPGTLGRRPALEPPIRKIELGSFEIDRLPFPNDPASPPLTGLSREEARSRCAESGARLCTELEWERACKGPESNPYPTGELFDARCAAQPTKCASGFDVLGMGLAHREWTANDLGNTADAMAVVRGSHQESPIEEHRCAARIGLRSNLHDRDVGFRCCKGAPNAALVPEPTLGKAYEKTLLSVQRLEQILKSSSTTKALADNVQFFREPEAADTVVEKGSGDRKGLTFSVAPVAWNPSLGVRFLLLTGRSGKDTSFVLAYNIVAKDDYSLAASFVMKNEPGPVALAFDDSIKPRMFFSSCWGCPGETGKILFREPEGVVIVQP